MKRILFTLLTVTIFFTLPALAQDSIRSPYREIYLSTTFTPFRFDVKFKKQLRPKTFLKIGLVNLSANMNGNDNNVSPGFPIRSVSYSGGLEAGIEFRRGLNKRLTFFNGPSLRVLYQYASTVNTNPQPGQNFRSESAALAIPYTLGILYEASRNILVAFEVNPTIQLNTQVSRNGSNRIYGYNAGFQLDSRGVLLSAVYRF